jgi:hypothetical protein
LPDEDAIENIAFIRCRDACRSNALADYLHLAEQTASTRQVAA